MPHCIIEHSSSLNQSIDFDALMDTVFNVMNNTELFSPTAIKVRCLSFDKQRIEGNCDSFIHITLNILKGRPAEAKLHITKTVFEHLKTIADTEKTQLSVNIHDMDPDFYQK